MSRARHHKKAMGGGVKPVWNAGGEQNAAHEAEEKKHGGKVGHMHVEGHAAKHRGDHKKRAAGGAVPARAHGGKVEHEGHKHHHRGRARGGGVGAEMKPLSSASKIKEVTKGEMPSGGVHSN